MNRFVLHAEPDKAARQHCDKHVVKMIIEEAQMLSTVHRVHGYEGEALYRATHKNHPCTRWAAESTANYRWAYRLFINLLAEYKHRYGRTHGSARLAVPLVLPPPGVPKGPLTAIPQAMPEQYRGTNPISAYRRFYIAEKARFATWRNRPKPEWWP